MKTDYYDQIEALLIEMKINTASLKSSRAQIDKYWEQYLLRKIEVMSSIVKRLRTKEILSQFHKPNYI